MAAIKNTMELYARQVARMKANDNPLQGHIAKSIVRDELTPDEKLEAFIVMETSSRYEAMRIVASLIEIEKERSRIEGTGFYISVTTAFPVRR